MPICLVLELRASIAAAAAPGPAHLQEGGAVEEVGQEADEEVAAEVGAEAGAGDEEDVQRREEEEGDEEVERV